MVDCKRKNKKIWRTLTIADTTTTAYAENLNIKLKKMIGPLKAAKSTPINIY